MSAKSRRAVALIAVAFLLVAGGLAALYLTNRREVTTTSAAAYESYQEGVANERRFYMKDAQVAYAKALELDPNFAMAMLRLAGHSNREQAVSLIDRAARLRGRLNERERLYVDMAQAQMAGNLEARNKAAQTIRERFPEDVDAAMVLAGNEMVKGNADRALQIYSELIAIDPNNAGVYNQIGYYYAWRGDYDKAIENLKKYQFMAPDQANPFDSLGEVQAFSGHYDEAIKNLNRALALKPDFFESYGHLGVAYEGMGDYPKAIENYLRGALECVIDGRRGDFLGQALRVAFRSGDKAAFKRVVQKIAELPRDKSYELTTAYAAAVTSLLDGQPAEAERRLKELRPKLEASFNQEMKGTPYKPYFPRWNTLMSLAKVRQGKTDEAIALDEEVVNPPIPWGSFEGRRYVYEGRARLAELLARKGDLDRAEKLLAENHHWNPNWAPTKPAEEVVSQLRREKVLAATR
jgi:tetratricopeptide (TPR) repeat protein